MLQLRAIIVAAALLISGGAMAETLRVDSDSAVQFEHPGKPGRGMTRERVEAKFGPPQARQNAVGDPPISRWEYADFVVFFEYDRVIHSVTKRGDARR